LKIAILFGGCSSEYAISLQSAHAVIAHLDRNRFEPILLGITSGGEWFRFRGDPARIESDTWCNPSDCTRAIISPSREVRGVLEFEANAVRTTRLDAALPVLHGRYGEDGTVQGLLELAGIPVVGCKTLSSALCMDKDRAHQLAQLAGMQVPRSFVLESANDAKRAPAWAQTLGYPLFVKPVRAGSSFGVTRVLSKDGLPAAIRLAFEYDNRVLLEEGISGFEVCCAVLGNRELIVGELGDIELAGGFFDHREKYLRETATIHVPARLAPHRAEEIKATAQAIYRALGCTGFARVDLFVTELGQLVFNEVNTIPGFTPHSPYPAMLEAIGIPFRQVISTAIDLALSQGA
jgi:D-alanine---D-serine ligase